MAFFFLFLKKKTHFFVYFREKVRPLLIHAAEFDQVNKESSGVIDMSVS